MIKTLSTSLALLALLGSGCKAPRPPSGDARHPLTGKVISVDAASRTVTIAHEDIPGFMPAMTMSFVVLEEDAASLAAVTPGDEVKATLVARDSRYWLEGLVVVRKGVAAPAAAAPTAHVARPGDLLPDVALVDQDGHGFRTADLRGRAVAVTFVYTRCPLPDYCPLMMRRFQQAEALLLADARLRERVRLLTVSFDPQHDTPAVLRRFGAGFQRSEPPFAYWTLASGEAEAIRSLGGALELEYVEESRSFTHNLRTAVVGQDGTLRRLFRGNEWSAEELLAELGKAAT